MALYGARRIWPLKTQRTRDNGALRLDGKAIRWRVADEKKKNKQSAWSALRLRPARSGTCLGALRSFFPPFLFLPPLFSSPFSLYFFFTFFCSYLRYSQDGPPITPQEAPHAAECCCKVNFCKFFAAKTR